MDKIIERVQKLLALAGNNPNEHEAAAAMEKAHALLAEHNLSMSSIEQTKESSKRGEFGTKTNFSEVYYRDLWQAVGALYFCDYIWWRPNPKKRETHHFFIGQPHNAAVAVSMAQYLTGVATRSAREAGKEAGRKDFRFFNSFMHGCSGRLVSRIYERKRQAEAGAATATEGKTNLPALAPMYNLEAKANALWIREHYLNLREGKTREINVDPGAYRAGKRAAETISLDTQVEAKPGEVKTIK